MYNQPQNQEPSEYNVVTTSIPKSNSFHSEIPPTSSPTLTQNNTDNTSQRTIENKHVDTSQTEFFLKQLELDKAQKESTSRKALLDKRQQEVEARQKELEKQKRLLEEQQRSIRENIEKERQKSRERAKLKQYELEEKQQNIEAKRNKLNQSRGKAVEAPNTSTEDKRIKETLYSYLIDNVKNTANNSHRISDLVMNSFDRLLDKTSEEFSLFKEIVEYLSIIVKRLNEILKDSFLNLDDNLHTSISSSAQNLTCSAMSLVNLSNKLMDQSIGFAERENLKSNIKQSCVAVTFSIKRFIEELEGLKISEGLNPANIPILTASSIEEAEDIVDKAKLTQAEYQHVESIASPKKRDVHLNIERIDASSFDSSKYPIESVKKVQAIVRKWALIYRFRSIVCKWKDSKESGVLRTRYKVVFEILDTEKRYIDSLELCKRCFLDEYVKASKLTPAPITARQIEIIFGSLESILSFSKNLYRQLEERLKKWPSVQLVGDVFVENAEQMIIYADYINGFDDAMKQYAVVKANPAFQELERKCIDLSASRMDSPSFLIMPVQRLPRYQLLLRELIKHTHADHVDYNNLVEAKDRITAINIEVNKRKREYDNRLIAEKVKGEIIGIHGVDIIQKDRLFVKSCSVTVEVDGDKYHCRLYLFNDILILTKASKKHSNPPYRFVEHIGLLDAGVVMNKSWWKKSIKLWDKSGSRKRDWLLHFSEDDECDAWYKDLSEAIETHSLRNMLNENISSTPVSQDTKLTILSATYGDLKRPKFCIDVTGQLQNIIETMGGKMLNLAKGTKSTLPGFTDPVKGKKKHMLIVYSVSGVIKTKTFEDEDPIKLP